MSLITFNLFDPAFVFSATNRSVTTSVVGSFSDMYLIVTRTSDTNVNIQTNIYPTSGTVPWTVLIAKTTGDFDYFGSNFYGTFGSGFMSDNRNFTLDISDGPWYVNVYAYQGGPVVYNYDISPKVLIPN